MSSLLPLIFRCAVGTTQEVGPDAADKAAGEHVELSVEGRYGASYLPVEFADVFAARVGLAARQEHVHVLLLEVFGAIECARAADDQRVLQHIGLVRERVVENGGPSDHGEHVDLIVDQRVRVDDDALLALIVDAPVARLEHHKRADLDAVELERREARVGQNDHTAQSADYDIIANRVRHVVEGGDARRRHARVAAEVDADALGTGHIVVLEHNGGRLRHVDGAQVVAIEHVVVFDERRRPEGEHDQVVANEVGATGCGDAVVDRVVHNIVLDRNAVGRVADADGGREAVVERRVAHVARTVRVVFAHVVEIDSKAFIFTDITKIKRKKHNYI